MSASNTVQNSEWRVEVGSRVKALSFRELRTARKGQPAFKNFSHRLSGYLTWALPLFHQKFLGNTSVKFQDEPFNIVSLLYFLI